MGFSLPFFLAVVFIKKSTTTSKLEPIKIKDWYKIILIAFGGYYLSSVFDFWGLEYVTASLERLILFIYPTLVVLISLLFYKRKFTKIILMALFFAYAGIGLVLSGENLTGNTNLFKGTILIFGAAITYASYLVGSEFMIEKFGNIRYTSIVMSIACVCILIHFFLFTTFSIKDLTIDILIKSFIMALFCTVIPAFLISEGIKKIGSANAAIIASVGPVSTIFLANYILDEHIKSIQIVGTFLVLVGVVLISLFGKKPSSS